MKALRWLIVVAFACIAAGCVSEPTLDLYGARIASAGPNGVTLQMTMKVTNPNSFDVKIRNVRCNVTIANRFVLPYMQYNPDQWLGSDSATLVQVPMTIPWNMVTPMVQTTLGSNLLSYRIVGFADVTAVRLLNIERNDYGLDKQGAFSRLDLVMAAGRGILGDGKTPSEPVAIAVEPLRAWATGAASPFAPYEM